MRERNGEAVRRRNGHAQAGAGNRAREGDDTAARREHGCSRLAANVDAAMLPGRVRVRGVEHEVLKHRAACRPGPRTRDGNEDESGHGDDDNAAETRHRDHHFLVA
jgi:hypothetical protein